MLSSLGGGGYNYDYDLTDVLLPFDSNSTALYNHSTTYVTTVGLPVCGLLRCGLNKQAVRVATHYASAPCKLTISSYLFARWHLLRHVGYLRHQQQVDLFDLLTLKLVFESRVTRATSVPILVFLGLSVLELGPMYGTDRQTSDKSIA